MWKLGDIVNASPVVVGAPPFFYPDPDYQAYYAARKDRPAVAYVPSQSGGIHAFDVETGTERWFVIPSFNLPVLRDLMSPSYCHRFTMDGPPRVVDAVVSVDGAPADWRTILIAGGGVHGAYVALDVTDPGDVGSPNPPQVLWQWPAPVDPVDPGTLEVPELGEPRHRPRVIYGQAPGPEGFPQSPVDRWRAWIPSGPASSDGEARLFEVELASGQLLASHELDPADETGNWASPVASIDRDGDLVQDLVYAGTADGTLWRLDLGADPVQPQLLYDTGGLPITARPVLSFASDVVGTPDVLVFTGSGRFETSEDKVDTTVQRIYGIRDPSTVLGSPPGTDPIWTTGDLVDQTDPDPDLDEFPSTGWYVDLLLGDGAGIDPANPAQGARILSAPLLVNGILFQSVFTPTADPCDFGGEAALLALAYATGAAPPVPVLDVDGDGDVDEDDLVDGEVPTGVVLGAGMPSPPVLDGENGAVIVQTSDTSIHTTQIDTDGFPVETRRWRVVR